MILMGHNATYVAAYHKQQCIDSLLISGTQYNIKDHYAFFDKFKKYSVSLILDTSNVAMSSADISAAPNTNNNPTAQYIAKNFAAKDLVSHNVYDITSDTTKTWRTCFATTPVTPLAMTMVEYVADNFAHFSGVYFLNLNIPTLTSGLLRIAGINIQSQFQVCATITTSSGIRVVVSNGKNILYSGKAEYSAGQSQSDALNVFEQEIINCLESTKHILGDSATNTALVIFTNKEMQDMLQNSKFNVNQVVIAPTTSFALDSDQELVDKAILNILSNRLVAPASNDALSAIRKLTRYNLFFLKPVFLVLAAFIVLSAVNIFKAKTRLWDTEKINAEYDKTLEQVNAIKEKYPNIQNLDQIIDFYDATIALRQPQILPFEALDKVLGTLPSEFNFDTIFCDSDGDNTANSDLKAHIKISISTKYVSDISSKDVAIEKLEADVADLTRALPLYDITYTPNADNVLHRGTKVIIPVELIITGPRR